jgi:hypothetical protein
MAFYTCKRLFFVLLFQNNQLLQNSFLNKATAIMAQQLQQQQKH